jgi:hypothetical protein
MKPQASLPCPQEPATGRSAEPLAPAHTRYALPHLRPNVTSGLLPARFSTI